MNQGKLPPALSIFLNLFIYLFILFWEKNGLEGGDEGNLLTRLDLIGWDFLFLAITVC